MIILRERVKFLFKKNDPCQMWGPVDGPTEVHDVFVLHHLDWLLEFKISRYLRSTRKSDSVLKKAAGVAGKNWCNNQSDTFTLSFEIHFNLLK